MRLFSFVTAVSALALLIVLVWRAARGKFVASFPVFYSYLIYILCGETVIFIAAQLASPLHWTIWWRYFLLRLVAEFAVLIEISDHVFNPFPAIRRLGRGLTLLVCLVFSISIVPSLFRSESTTMALLKFGELTSVSKAAIICLLLAAARYYRLPLGRNVSGLMLGFSAYVGVNVANFALAERLGRVLYGTTFSIVGVMSYILCLLIWTLALWRYEPAVATVSSGRGDEQESSESINYRLEHFNTMLGSRLRK